MHSIVSELKGKIVFFDFDGVLGSYQATKENVHIDEEEYIKRHITERNPFEYTKAPKTIREIVQELNPNTTFVLSNMASTFELRNKEKFINTNYPSIKTDNILFVSNDSYKRLIIEALYNTYYIGEYRKCDIVLIEDTISIISDVESAGFKCYHISSLID